MDKDYSASIERRIALLESEQKKSGELMQEIKTELARYKGFVGGIVWVIGAMLLFVKSLWPMISAFMFGGK